MSKDNDAPHHIHIPLASDHDGQRLGDEKMRLHLTFAPQLV